MKFFLFFILILKTENCMVCHSEVKGKYLNSIHYRENIGCTSCHGGDEESLDVNKAHTNGFKGIPDKPQTIKICSSCHSSPEIMKPYGIPFVQEILYYTSAHGKSFKRGNKDVAVCTDCHGTHEVLPSYNTLSPVNRLNISKTCGKCHSDFNLMKKYGISSEVVLEYNLSIHAKEARKGNRNSPVCIDCHGAHGATSSSTGSIEKVCGKCHIRTRDYFLKSYHSKVWKGLGYLECEVCHGNHLVKETNHNLWKEKCIECHSRDSKNYKLAEEIYTLFITAEMGILKAEELIEEIRKIPLDVEDFLGRLEEARTYLIEAEPVSHSLSLEEIKRLITKSISIAQEIQRETIRKKKLFDSRKILLPIFWFLIFFTIALIIYYRRA